MLVQISDLVNKLSFTLFSLTFLLQAMINIKYIRHTFTHMGSVVSFVETHLINLAIFV